MKRASLIAAGILAMLLLAEVVLQLLPVPSGIFLADPSDRWQTRRLVPGARTTMSFGWDLMHVTHGTVNSDGFTAPFDYRDGARVGAVIGDSYVEGLSTAPGERLAPGIARALGQPEASVYNFGISGASLPHYLGLARIIGARYRPEWAAVVVTEQDFEEGFTPAEGLNHWSGQPSLIAYSPLEPHGAVTRIVRNSAVYRYVRMNLKFSLQSLFSSGFGKPHGAGPTTCPPTQLSGADKVLLERWLAALSAALHLPPSKIVLVFDSNRKSYDTFSHAAPPCPTRDNLALRYLLDQSRQNGFASLDTAPLFAAAWQRDHQPFDHYPLDRHWTAYSNRLVARAVAAKLQGNQR